MNSGYSRYCAQFRRCAPCDLRTGFLPLQEHGVVWEIAA